MYCTDTCAILTFHATTLAPSTPVDVTVPVSPLLPSVTDHTSHGACVLPALHHISSKLVFVVYLQILATALGVVGVFCVFSSRECTCVRHKWCLGCTLSKQYNFTP